MDKWMDLPGFDIRYTYLTDTFYLKRWLNHPGMLHWFPMSDEKEIEDAVQCWMGFCRYSSSLTATLQGVPCGMGTLFLMPYQKVSHHSLFKLIVDPEHQRKGIGTSLVRNLKHLAKNYFQLELIHTEVFEKNPLISLLQKLEFTEFGYQENYVKEGDHYLARVLLECPL
jgi:ribosomal protein S18 acetylase RimI-like enzyme